ncbi:MAG TPA: hypothetical protein VM935_09380 [Chitinophagaceae bacterium]|nr:hypothetical protein [Chitinophagaceae bacterium]
MGTIITALIVVGFIAGIVALLVFVNNRDKKAEARKKASSV